MKKFLCVFLAAVLMLGCLPAAAAEIFDPPLWAEYGYDSLDEMLTDWDMTEDEYWDMVEEELSWRNWTYDETTGDFDPPMWEKYGYESLKEMLSDWEITEDEYKDMVQEERASRERESWTSEQWDAYFDELLQTEKKEMGLVYDINVMLRDQPFTFKDVQPELVNSRVMVPLRAVMDNMGAATEFDNASRRATIISGEKTLSIAAGADTMTITENGETSAVALDSAAYIKNDRMFVPVRAVAEALGYDVFWSSDYKTAVFFDKTAIIDELNQNYSVINKVLSMGQSVDMTKNYRGNVNLDVSVTAFDSVNGDKTYKGGMKTTVLENGKSIKMNLSFDIEAVLQLLKQYGAAYLELSDDDESYADIMTILNVVNDSTTEIIFDLDSAMLYIKSELLSIALSKEGIALDKNSWLSVDLAELTGDEMNLRGYLDSVMALQNQGVTMGDMIYLQNTSSGWIEPVYSYQYMMSDLENAGIDDSAFTRSGSTYKFSHKSTADDYSTLDGYTDITINTSGSRAVSVSGKGEYTGDYGYGYGTYQAKFDFSLSPMNVKFSGSYHLKNSFKIEVKLSSAVSQTASSVPTAPPASETVVPLTQLLGTSAAA